MLEHRRAGHRDPPQIERKEKVFQRIKQCCYGAEELGAEEPQGTREAMGIIALGEFGQDCSSRGRPLELQWEELVGSP